jgi:hypothetical protein
MSSGDGPGFTADELLAEGQSRAMEKIKGEWQEEEKIVIKKPAPPTPTPPKAEEGGEEKKDGAAPVE